jgi:DNA-binding transcriptional ArsR family regulator
LARLVFVLTRFWEDHGRELDAIDRPIIQRSMSYHERQEYSGTAAEIFLAVTGQAVLGDAFAAMLEKARHLVFIPSCYIGALAMFSVPPGDDETLLVSFNARSTGVNEGAQGEIVSQVFAPLKALADETRLHIVTLLRGRELYAQQIVDQLKQSQSTISRHLNLLVTGGILSTREESGRKYYSIHMPSVERFLEQLHEMTREGEADARGPHAEGETLESART